VGATKLSTKHYIYQQLFKLSRTCIYKQYWDSIPYVPYFILSTWQEPASKMMQALLSYNKIILMLVCPCEALSLRISVHNESTIC